MNPPTHQSSADDADLGFETPLPEINTHLSHLWVDQARSRASMMNLAIYEEDEDSLGRNSKILAEITADHACRGILIAAPPRCHGEHSIRAWVTAHCQLRGGEKSVCSEQIAFLIHSPHPDIVRNTVFAHLDSDLPLVLWWKGDFSDHFDERFYSVIDRLIIDSTSWSDPLPQFAILEAAHSESSAHFAVNDLAWSRSFHQRLALASLFEDPRLAAGLATLQSITVGHKSGNRVPAMMLAAWIITRLGLQPAGEPSHHQTEGVAFSSPDGHPVQIRFEDSGVAGRTSIKSLQLSGTGWDVSLVRRSESQFIHSHTEIGDFAAESFFPADVRGDGLLISQILSRRGMNRLYFEMFPLLKILLAVPSDSASSLPVPLS